MVRDTSNTYEFTSRLAAWRRIGCPMGLSRPAEWPFRIPSTVAAADALLEDKKSSPSRIVELS
jgi:hypothetical protein